MVNITHHAMYSSLMVCELQPKAVLFSSVFMYLYQFSNGPVLPMLHFEDIVDLNLQNYEVDPSFGVLLFAKYIRRH